MRNPEYAIDDPVQWIRFCITRQREDERRTRSFILDVTERGVISQRELAKQLGVSHRTIGTWVDLARAERDGSAG
ncbi:hypothetical protein JG551_002975 [Curtobacterium flaccumfaciens pv. flaccumfaciens]|uniref:hypothetical protein n=1 Tax=Curtobacterium flaccumfaciens TaxID=2035 RepID=UPI001BCC369C|nr:hypothetical protein [Curtobacterium flaccumfaciens]QVG65542.1 hypothetical protein JG551_002975 [Curtobacterium flaccumfaciens pv. flaccumfaciens]